MALRVDAAHAEDPIVFRKRQRNRRGVAGVRDIGPGRVGRRTPPLPWAALLNIAGNPLLPTMAEAMRQVLTAEETDRLTAQLQPQVEQGRGKQRIAIAYLSALRPDDTGHGD